MAPLAVNIQSLNRTSGSLTAFASHALLWYYRLMPSGRIICHRGHTLLRTSRATDGADSHSPHAEIQTFIRVENNLPAITSMLLASPLSPEVMVPEPLILRYFPTLFDDLLLDNRTAAHVRRSCLS